MNGRSTCTFSSGLGLRTEIPSPSHGLHEFSSGTWAAVGLIAFLLSGMMPQQATAQQDAVELNPVKDNTLYEDTGGSLSNGAGEYLFTGTTNQGSIRRALLAFDVAGNVPEGATVDSVSLTMNMSRTISGALPVALHRVTADWGEGTSDAPANEGQGTQAALDDATWLHAFYDTEEWSQPGGDFASTASATIDVGAEGSYTWTTTAQLVDDVQAWLDDPDQNFGWIVIGPENASGSAKRFDSRENGNEANRPLLRVYYSVSTSTEEASLPEAFQLVDAYPNPFRDAATITLDVQRPAHVRIEVFDVLGRRVHRLAEEALPAGVHRYTWRGNDERGRVLPNGLYLIRLSTEGRSTSKTLVLQR